MIWRPYQLRPQAPEAGVPKPPDTPDNPRVGRRLKSAGEAVGIDFSGKTDRSPNTLVAHALLEHALEKGGSEKQNEVQEALFKAYFTDGIYPDVDSVKSIGVSCGLDAYGVESALTDATTLKQVQQKVHQNYGVVDGGVPTFIINNQPAFSGAQDPATFHRAFDSMLLD